MFICICRLSYHQRVKDMTPETLAPLVPLKPEPIYKYSMEGAGKINKMN